MGTKSGTEERIVAVYRETIDALYAYVARTSCGDRTLAEDVTQETWLLAVREWRRKGPPDRPLAWLSGAGRLSSIRFRQRTCWRRSRTAALQQARARLQQLHATSNFGSVFSAATSKARSWRRLFVAPS